MITILKMDSCKGNDSATIDEETKKIRRTQEEKFKGKLNENDTKCLLFLNSGDPDAAQKDLCEGSVKDLKEKIEGTVEEVKLKKDAVLKALHEKTATGYVVREYACRPCDRVWWRWTPARKQVSTCHRCKVKYDPVPEDKEFGWAVYRCFCGNNFNGYGQMKTFSKCHKGRGGCGRDILPTKILPPNKRPVQNLGPVNDCSNKTDTTSTYAAAVLYQRTSTDIDITKRQNNTVKEPTTDPDGGISEHSVPNMSDKKRESHDDLLKAEVKKDRRPKSRRAKYNEKEELYKDLGSPVDTGSHNTTVYIGHRFKGGINVGYDLDKMPWPRGRGRKSSKKSPLETRELAAGKKKVWYASTPHVSTGSTVATFLTQDNMSVTSSYIATLQRIDE